MISTADRSMKLECKKRYISKKCKMSTKLRQELVKCTILWNKSKFLRSKKCCANKWQLSIVRKSPYKLSNRTLWMYNLISIGPQCSIPGYRIKMGFLANLSSRLNTIKNLQAWWILAHQSINSIRLSETSLSHQREPPSRIWSNPDLLILPSGNNLSCHQLRCQLRYHEACPWIAPWSPMTEWSQILRNN